MNRHLESPEIVRLVAGELSAAEAEPYLAHLEDCEACLELTEALWAGLPALLVEEAEPLSMPKSSAAEIERRLLGRIRVAGTGSQMAWLMTEGFVRVLVVLSRPLVASPGHIDLRRGTSR